MAEWLGTGLQNPLLRFNSGRDLQLHFKLGEWWNGIHATLKMLCQKHEGSSPSSPTKAKAESDDLAFGLFPRFYLLHDLRNLFEIFD